MKKLIVILCALLLLTIGAAAEEVSMDELMEGLTVVENFVGKTVLWEVVQSAEDQDGNTETRVVRVTFEAKEPVTLSEYPLTSEDVLNQVCMVRIERDGVAPVVVSLSQANMGAHYNLNDYTEEQLQEYIKSIAEYNYDEYTSEILRSEGGNVYVAVGDEFTRSISIIYDDFLMEVFQGNYVIEKQEFEPLTDADKAFALEVFQGIWTEE